MSTTEAGDPEPSNVRFGQPWRVVLVGAETVVAALLVAGAFLAWGRANVLMELPGLPDAIGAVSRMLGNWVAISVLAVTIAGLLVLDAVRRVVLGWRTRHRAVSATAAGPVAEGSSAGEA